MEFKKTFIYLLIIFFVSTPFWIKNIPLKQLSFFIGKSAVIDQYICKYSAKIGGDSMEPILIRGNSIKLNRCFGESDLTEGTIVLFNKDSETHLGVIRHILLLDPTIYKVSSERPNERLQDIISQEIVAINKDIDTSNSTYQSDKNIDSFILNPKEYLSDLYLGKIPKGSDIEMAEVEKTNTFSKDNNKFCLVVEPKKELTNVNTEIINADTKEVVISRKNIIFAVWSKPNINCQDFGTDPGNLNLLSGNYHYRFLLNHQVLADIQFVVE